jgi:hypothetical protein
MALPNGRGWLDFVAARLCDTWPIRLAALVAQGYAGQILWVAGFWWAWAPTRSWENPRRLLTVRR